jgi:hypothetical protein
VIGPEIRPAVTVVKQHFGEFARPVNVNVMVGIGEPFHAAVLEPRHGRGHLPSTLFS